MRLNPDGNDRLIAAAGVLLLVPILVELAKILLGVHTFISLHARRRTAPRDAPTGEAVSTGSGIRPR